MKKKLFLSISSVAMLLGCADNVVNSYEEAKDTAKITLSILDGNSREPIDSASVQSQFDKKPSLTNENGYVIFKDQQIGSYIYEISKKGYATIRTTVSVEETGANDVSRVPDVAKTVAMYKSGVTASGYVYYEDAETGNLLPAKEVTVILSYPTAAIFPSEVVTKTDDKGAYEFKDLAEKVEYSVEALQSTIDKKLYKSNAAVTANDIRSGSSKVLDKIVMKVDGEAPMLLSSNLNSIDTSTTVKLTFSVALDADSILGNWSVQKGGSSVLTTAKLSEDGKTVSITPASKTWSNNASYSISGRAYSKDGISVNVSKGFTVGSVAMPSQVSDLKVETDSTDYDEDYSDTYNYNNNILMVLSWKAPKGDVDGYKIYYKTNDMDDYMYYVETSTTTYSRTLGNLSSALTSAKTVSFIVLPYNAAGTANAADAKSVSWTVAK